jgi:hypothetical protein
MRLVIATVVAFFFFPWSGFQACDDCAPHNPPAPVWRVADAEGIVAAPTQMALAAAPNLTEVELDAPVSPNVSIDSPVDVPALDVTRAVEAFENALPPPVASIEQICETLISAASAHDLPIPFFIRLIWRESRFDPLAISPAGAQGVAQFMPRVAAEFGLSNPFDPVEALPRSAKFLNMLYQQFGNLGLAAAAYNAGAKRIQDWLANRGNLPSETRAYVLGVTGHAAERWREANLEEAELDVPARVPCQHAATMIRVPPAEPPPPPPETVVAKSDKRDSKSEKATKTAAADEADKSAKGKKAKKDDLSDTSASSEKRWVLQLATEKTREGALKRFHRLKQHAKALSKRAVDIVDAKLAGRRTPMKRIEVVFVSKATAEQVCDRLRGAGETCKVVQD